MKKLLTISTALLLLVGCITDTNTEQSSAKVDEHAGHDHGEAKPDALSDTTNYTTIHWIDSTKNLGKIAEGQKVEIVYRFENTGNKPLIIQSAQPSCGCTVPEKPEEPIMPGKQGQIKAVFDSKGRMGANHKTINVMTNTKFGVNHVLDFTVEVVDAKENATSVKTSAQGNTF